MNRVHLRELCLAVFVIGGGMGVLYLATEPRRAAERRGHCVTNLKMIGLAMMQYAQDNDGTLPRAWFGRDDGPSDANVNYKWMDAIFHLVKDEKYFYCPADRINHPYRFRRRQEYGSYVINNAYFLPGDKQTPPACAKLSQIVSPAYTAMITDGEGDFQFSWPDAKHTPLLYQDEPFKLDTIRGRHGPGIYNSAMVGDCGGALSTANWDFVSRTMVINGIKIYTALTIENEEP